MYEAGTPLHNLVNKLSAEKVRIQHGQKQCKKEECECVGFALVYTAIENLTKAIDSFTEEAKNV